MNWKKLLGTLAMGGMLVEEAGCGRQTPPGTLRWVALGDSLTVGYGATTEQSYPNRVQVLSGEEGKPVDCVKNLANGGHTLAKVQLMQLPQAAAYRPDIVSIWAGTNDALLNAVTGIPKDHLSGEPLPTSPENFERRLNAVLEKLSSMKLRGIYIAKLHDLSKIPVTQGWDEERIETVRRTVAAYNAAIERATEKYPNVHVVPLDRLDVLVDPAEYMKDGIHPRPQVYKKVGKAFWAAMADTL